MIEWDHYDIYSRRTLYGCGSTFMPMVFGILQEHLGIGIMPSYLLIFAVLNIALLETAYRRVDV